MLTNRVACTSVWYIGGLVYPRVAFSHRENIQRVYDVFSIRTRMYSRMRIREHVCSLSSISRIPFIWTIKNENISCKACFFRGFSVLWMCTLHIHTLNICKILPLFSMLFPFNFSHMLCYFLRLSLRFLFLHISLSIMQSRVWNILYKLNDHFRIHNSLNIFILPTVLPALNRDTSH